MAKNDVEFIRRSISAVAPVSISTSYHRYVLHADLAGDGMRYPLLINIPVVIPTGIVVKPPEGWQPVITTAWSMAYLGIYAITDFIREEDGHPIEVSLVRRMPLIEDKDDRRWVQERQAKAVRHGQIIAELVFVPHPPKGKMVVSDQFAVFDDDE